MSVSVLHDRGIKPSCSDETKEHSGMRQTVSGGCKRDTEDAISRCSRKEVTA
jgi:hypothetical protein